MDEKKFLAEQFEANRDHLRSVAYRMLGSLPEAEDAVQETWIRLSRTDPGEIQNLGGWLTTVAARVCLDMLRARKARREEPLEVPLPVLDTRADNDNGFEPEREILLADSIGLALIVVLETLTPAERVAFVLHDLFDLPFEEIAPIVGRSPDAARQLASRARRRVRGGAKTPDADFTQQRQVIEAFLAASRGGDFNALLSLLDPDVVARADAAAVRLGAMPELRGATTVAEFFKDRRARVARPALLDGKLGIAVAPAGRLRFVVQVTIKDGKIAAMEAIADPKRYGQIDVAVLE